MDFMEFIPKGWDDVFMVFGSCPPNLCKEQEFLTHSLGLRGIASPVKSFPATVEVI